MKLWRSIAFGVILVLGMYVASPVDAAAKKPLVIAEQGSFTVGGAYKEKPGTFRQENFTAEEGQRAYGDFAYVEYQKPVKAKKLPLIFQHGGAQSKRTWESGPDLIPCLYGPGILCIWLTSPAVVKPIFPRRP